ncbi:hypothetical protein KVR01_011339 [Diaporthe batatas]|uniref:uncharacterized protein n=1 Tax=Diaporthe batatas TaxID=748121 RepID=UPI001D036E50|nr:uncharacterized protein KVR01_011339 [Diaporthe batatas]KAG8158896.1 hypothetical protein KVR01_011339 [Diaporthe batatas]
MQRLSHFDQASLRTYIQIVLAFPLADDASAQAIYEHLRASLNHVGQAFPVLATKLQLETSRFGQEAFLTPSQEEIPLVADIGGADYASLAARGFPAHEFIRPDFDLNNTLKLNEGPVPVAHARVRFISGGFLLFCSVHHSAADGYGLGQFVEAFAAATRGLEIMGEPSRTVLDLPQDPDISEETLLTLSQGCPEFAVVLEPNSLPSLPDILPGGTPSREIPSEAKIFVFRIDKIDELRTKVNEALGPNARLQKPSAFMVLAALTWAHVTKARCGSEQCTAPPSTDADLGKIFIPIDFRRRFHEETLDYFGNAVVTIPIETPVKELISVCGEQNLPAFAKLVNLIADAVAGVGQADILRREALFRRLGDCRRLVLSQDRRLRGQIQLNSWRYFGGNNVWEIPGMGSRKPDAVRRIQGEVSPGNALLLPLNSESEFYEMSLALPTVSMSALLRDEEWMSWVDRVID